MRRDNWHKLIAAVVAAILAGGITYTVTDDGHGHTVRTFKIVVPHAVEVPTQAPQGDLESGSATGTEAPAQSDLRDESPPGVPAKALEAGKAKTDELGQKAGVTDVAQPVGGAQNYSIRKDFSGHVYSDFYAGVTPTEFCLHYTVSPNVTGWGDVTGVQGYFIRTKIGSATFILDFESHLLQMVPLDHKAWTQGAFNPYCRASVEIIATGRESRAEWLAASIFRKRTLASLMVDVMRRYNLPVRFVDPVGCAAPAGYTDHNHIECGNDHTDVAPTFPFDVLKKQLAEEQRPACGRACQLRAKHKRTHARFRKNRCAHGHKGRPIVHGYCGTLRSRNAAVHRAARREHVSLKGTYR